MNIRIIGLGNVLMSDDGFGPYVMRVLEAFYEMPQRVQVIDGGTPGMDLTPCLIGADAVIVIDTVKTPGSAGDIHVYRKSDVLARTMPSRPSVHDPNLRDALRATTLAGGGPAEVLVIGVNPEWVATGVSLSRSVRSAIAPVIGLIMTELERLGCRAPLRRMPRQPDTWWEKDVDAGHLVPPRHCAS